MVVVVIVALVLLVKKDERGVWSMFDDESGTSFWMKFAESMISENDDDEQTRGDESEEEGEGEDG